MPFVVWFVLGTVALAFVPGVEVLAAAVLWLSLALAAGFYLLLVGLARRGREHAVAGALRGACARPLRLRILARLW